MSVAETFFKLILLNQLWGISLLSMLMSWIVLVMPVSVQEVKLSIECSYSCYTGKEYAVPLSSLGNSVVGDGNDVGDEGAALLCGALKANRSLKKLK